MAAPIRRPLLDVLACLLLVLVPMAYASPPDQTWHAGLYDNGDFDDVVVFLTSSVGLTETQPLAHAATDVLCVKSLPMPDETVVSTTALAATQTRAPPLF